MGQQAGELTRRQLEAVADRARIGDRVLARGAVQRVGPPSQLGQDRLDLAGGL